MTGAVEDLHGVTHAVVLRADFGFAGITACDVRFWTSQRIPQTRLWAQWMTESEAPVDCMACLVSASSYDEACTDGSPPTSETA